MRDDAAPGPLTLASAPAQGPAESKIPWGGPAPGCLGREDARSFGAESLGRHAHELTVQPPVARQLGVEAKGEDPALPHRHWMTFIGGQHLDATGRFDQRRADERTWEVAAGPAVRP